MSLSNGQTLNPAGPTPARDLCFTVPSHVDEFDGIVGSHTLESLCQDASYIPRVRTAIGLTATMAYRMT